MGFGSLAVHFYCVTYHHPQDLATIFVNKTLLFSSDLCLE